MRHLLLLCLLIQCNIGSAQRSAVPDSLCGKPFSFFRERLDDDRLGASNQRIYAQSYLAIAKAEKNLPEIIEAYKAHLYLSDKETALRYADSMIMTAFKSGKNDLIGASFLTKGITFYKQKKHREALENYLKADSYISQTNDQYLIHKLKYSLAETKYLLKRYESAVSLLRECVIYYEKSSGKPWLNSLHHLGLCYIQLGKHDMCTSVNELGLREAIKQDYESMALYFTHSEGVNQYYRKNYNLALNKLQQSIPGLIRFDDMPNEMVAYFYIAKCYVELNEFSKALPYLLKIDEALIKHHYTRRDLREGISMLVNHYSSLGEKNLELQYAYHLRKADSILSTDFESVSNRLNKQKDQVNESRIAQLEQEKQETKNFWIYVSAIGLCVGIGIATITFYRHRKLMKSFRKNYDALLLNKDNPTKNIKINPPPNLELSDEKEVALLKSMEDFESKQRYLSPGITQIKMAGFLKTNTKYLAYIIKKYRQKGFVDYINDLKSEYLYAELKKQSKLRNYDQKSLAELAGFGTAQNLRRAFVKRYGFSLAFYIAELSRDLENNQISLAEV